MVAENNHHLNITPLNIHGLGASPLEFMTWRSVTRPRKESKSRERETDLTPKTPVNHVIANNFINLYVYQIQINKTKHYKQSPRLLYCERMRNTQMAQFLQLEQVLFSSSTSGSIYNDPPVSFSHPTSISLPVLTKKPSRGDFFGLPHLTEMPSQIAQHAMCQQWLYHQI